MVQNLLLLVLRFPSLKKLQKSTWKNVIEGGNGLKLIIISFMISFPEKVAKIHLLECFCG